MENQHQLTSEGDGPEDGHCNVNLRGAAGAPDHLGFTILPSFMKEIMSEPLPYNLR